MTPILIKTKPLTHHMFTDAIILPFILDADKLDINRLKQGDDKYVFRGHQMAMKNVPLPNDM